MKRNNFAVKTTSALIAAMILLSGCAEKEKANDSTVVSVANTSGSSLTSSSSVSQKSSLSTARLPAVSTGTVQSVETFSSAVVSTAPVSSATTVRSGTTVQAIVSEDDYEDEPVDTTSSLSSVGAPEAPSDPCERDVYSVLMSFKSKYPEGTPWTNETRRYKSYSIYPQYTYYEGQGCAAFALELSDAAFGDLPSKQHYDVDEIRVGDIIRMNNDMHSVIVLEVNSGGVVIAEGNFNNSVHWGRKVSTTDLEDNLTNILTRYP